MPQKFTSLQIPRILMSYSALLGRNRLELIGNLPFKGLLEISFTGMEHCLFLHKIPQIATEVTKVIL